jgi:hypothetical protein
MNRELNQADGVTATQIQATLPDAAVAITGTSTISLVEGPSQVLLSAVLNGISGSRLHKEMRYADPIDPNITSPAVIAPMADLPDELPLRILEILDKTLAALGDRLSEVDSSKVGVTLIMPSDRAGATLDKEMIGDILWSYLPDLQPRSLEVISENHSATGALKRLCVKLQAGEIESALFCGVDSHIDAQRYDELAIDGRLLTLSKPQGLIPGEGGSAVLLEALNHLKSSNREKPIPRAIMGNLAFEPEPNVGAAEEKPMTGLVKAMRAAVGKRKELLANTGAIFYALPSEIVFDLEWHQAKKQLWPQRLEESQRVAMMLGEKAAPQIEGEDNRQEYNLSNCLGEIGAATLPMLMALVCEKIQFDATYERWGFPVDNPLMICELGVHPWRGALWLTPYSTSNTQ